MPFIQMLGYDVFNPLEVIPEMDCDLIRKKGEKIDYAIMKDSKPIMVVECKHWRQDLSLHLNQLQAYFIASEAKFGVLTNGIVYRFYTNLVKPNKMDDVPFLEVNMENLKESQIEELKKFHKSYFDINNILSTASELKYMSELKSVIKSEFASPSNDFVRLLAKKVYDGVITSKVLDQFTDLVKRTIANHINDVMSERLNVAIKSTEEHVSTNVQPEEEEDKDTNSVDTKNKIETTIEELEGFYIVKSILRNTIASDRITHRDAQTFFAIFIDDNNRKAVCRLYFNSRQKAIGIVINKVETKYKIDSLDEIYNYQNELIESCSQYL
jgi:hypothetical protein